MANRDSRKPDAAEAAAKEIAKRILRIDTLDTSNADALDFHELAVWSIREALVAAYDAGAKATADDRITGQEG